MLREDFARGERTLGLVWLSLGAVFSLLLEVVYLGARISVGETSVAFPLTIVIAFFFNGVLVRTARLWSPKLWVALLPLIVWVLGYFAFLIVGDLGSIQPLGNNIRSVLLLFAGVAGGVRPLLR